MPLSRTHIILCLFCVSVTIKINASDVGSHSVLGFATYIKGDTPFPAFSLVLMLDDIQVGFFSSDQKLLARGPMKDQNTFGSIYDNLISGFQTMHELMTTKTHRLIYHYNNTYGVEVLQRIFGCDLTGRNTPGRMISKEAFSGVSGDEKYLSITDKTLETTFKWPWVWTALQSESIKSVIIDLYQPICMNTLYYLLDLNKKHVMRKVKPRVRLLQKALPDTGGVRVTCLATGFYPRHINLTLLRDGQPVAEQQISGGELLPNGDGSYQMRKSLEVSTEELQHHQYTCTAQHLSLDNKIDIPLEPRPGQNHAVLAVMMVLTLGGLTVFAIVIFMFCRKRLRGKRQKTERKDRKEEKEGEGEHAVPLKETAT